MKTRTRTTVVAGVLAVVVAAALLVLVVRYASRNPDEANLGSGVIRLRAERLAQTIDESGPLPMQDPRGDRDVFLQHTGDDHEEGWLLVLAYPPGREGEKRCALSWDVRRDVFRSPCEDRTYPPDGAGLTTFPAPVEEGRVVIDLRGD